MSNWTEAARLEWEAYQARVRPGLEMAGADAAEVLDDLRRHLESEASASKLAVITEADLRQLLRRIGAPEPGANPAGAASPKPPPVSAPREKTASKRPGWLWLAIGVVLPLVTLLIEWWTGMCAAVFFDPLPTDLHIPLVALVPLANAWCWYALARGDLRHARHLAWLNAAALGVAAFYAFLFLPLLLPGLFALIVYGWGLLPWSPMLSLVATIFLRRRLQGVCAAESVPLRGGWWGLAAAWLIVVTLDAPVWFTRAGLSLTMAEEPESQQRGLRWLRQLGNEDTLLRECYGRGRGAQDVDLVGWILGGGRRISAEKAREVYFRVTGRPFNSVPPPKVRTARGAWSGLEGWTWDADQGGERVGGRVSGLRVFSSRLDAIVEPEALVGYCEWTLEFKNDSRQQREARAQVQLPPGGVVSRLTLWINGEEREAAFGGRSQVREAYRKVVERRRDPVLVTTCGPDRVLVQCFPVPPNGGVMKMRLGITAPLEVRSPQEALFAWPQFMERNFTLRPDLRHSLWLDAPTNAILEAAGLASSQRESGTAAAHGMVPDQELLGGQGTVRLRRDAKITAAWAKDTRSPSGGWVRQTLSPQSNAVPPRLVVVVDGSASMKAYRAEIAKAIQTLPESVDLRVIVARDDDASTSSSAPQPPTAARQAALDHLHRADFAGGQDNLPALIEGWDSAAAQRGSALIWVHEPQPLLLSSTDLLRQRFERRPHDVRWLTLQTSPGPNRILEEFDGIEALQNVPRRGTLAEDLARLFADLTGGTPLWQLARTSLSDEAAAKAGSTCEATLHLARLWAHDEARRMQAQKKTASATGLAGRYQLVTPLTGAVVLETQAQYNQAGLEPVPPDSVPSIPEPATWLLGLGGAAAMLLLRRWSGRWLGQVRVAPATKGRPSRRLRSKRLGDG